ncbi:MAG: ABC transporter permease [Anaerolineae bacterium]|nr:ABC transporter permease [Anaerolineae bacterium]NUQ02872.1 ABC transporter permease [Anaerolineae bacterium]
MTYDLFLAWRSLRSRPVQSGITLLIIGLAVALPLVVLSLSDGARRGIVRASDPFGVLVIGAKGSGQQLVLSTLLLQGAPVGNIPTTLYTELRDDTRATLAVPIALGDNVGGARLVGTSADLLELRPSTTEPPTFRIVQGRFFEAAFEAVLGSAAAQALGLTVGDTFLASHGVAPGLEEDVHDEPYTIVGVFDSTSSPYDTAVFVSLESIWHTHEHEEDERLSAFDYAIEPTEPEQMITAVLVKPAGFIEANLLWQSFSTGTQAQAAFPGQELGALFDLFAQVERILGAVGGLVLVIAGLTAFLSLYNAIAAREGTIALMRALGCSRTSIFRVVILESLIATIAGIILGQLLGYVTALVIAALLTAQSAIPIPVQFLPTQATLLWLTPLLLGVAAAIIPAVRAYRVEIIQKLFPT